LGIRASPFGSERLARRSQLPRAQPTLRSQNKSERNVENQKNTKNKIKMFQIKSFSKMFVKKYKGGISNKKSWKKF
jgi:hypothetical protein